MRESARVEVAYVVGRRKARRILNGVECLLVTHVLPVTTDQQMVAAPQQIERTIRIDVDVLLFGGVGKAVGVEFQPITCAGINGAEAVGRFSIAIKLDVAGVGVNGPVTA